MVQIDSNECYGINKTSYDNLTNRLKSGLSKQRKANLKAINYICGKTLLTKQ